MIVFSGVTKSFGQEIPALSDVSFDIAEGELAVVTGPSGSGKTSLMRLLTKEYLPDAGDIVFQDNSLSQIRNADIHLHRRKIGVVFQDYKLLHDLNVWENIALALSIIGAPTSEIEARVTDLLKLVHLTEKAFLFPNQLSGGEAQRVSIARALSTAPSVIFADEPTGNLDPDTSASIIQLLSKINELGTTIMITTHDPVVLEVIKNPRHIILNQGKVTKDTGAKKPSEKVVIEVTTLDDTPNQNKQTNQKSKSEPEPKPEANHKPKEPDEPKESGEPKKTEQKKPEKKKADSTETKKRISLNLPGFISSLAKPDKKSDKENKDE